MRTNFWSPVALARWCVSYLDNCTVVRGEHPIYGPFRIIALGHFANIETLAFAIENGAHYELERG